MTTKPTKANLESHLKRAEQHNGDLKAELESVRWEVTRQTEELLDLERELDKPKSEYAEVVAREADGPLP